MKRNILLLAAVLTISIGAPDADVPKKVSDNTGKNVSDDDSKLQ